MKSFFQINAWALAAFFLLLAGALPAGAQPQTSEAADRTPKPLTFDAPYQDGPVYVVPIEGMIDKALANYIDRALEDAAATDAALVVFDIDTFGGLVDAADQIRKAILNAPMPTVAFIDKNAASAGALISYAADRIVMVPGASIGAATVVQGGTGEAAPDKYQSYMRGLMRATAEANGRDPRIAEAMVDENLEVEGVSEEGQVLTLSSSEANRLGVADAVIGDMDTLLADLDVQGREVVEHRATRAEQVLRFFGSPILQSILMLMMLGGLYFELQTPGVGFAGAMAAIGATLFFAPNYLLGFVESWEIVLFGIGVALLLAEIFVIPGFGIAGIGGLLLVVVSLGAALVGNVGLDFPSGAAISSAIGTMAITLVLLVVLVFSLGRYLPRSGRLSHLVLAPDLSSAAGYTSADTIQELLGQSGTALTPLRPAGAALIEGERVDVVTAGEFIPSGAAVQVMRVRGSRVEVRETATLPSGHPASDV
ncbi:MAG: NfeD family protein [Rhodothermales bacterium]